MYISIWLLNIWIFAFLAIWHSFCGSRLPRWWPNWQYKNKWCGCKIFYELLLSHSLKWLVIRRHLIRRACHNYDLILRVLFLLKCYFGTSPTWSNAVGDNNQFYINARSVPTLIMASFKKFSNDFHQFWWIWYPMLILHDQIFITCFGLSLSSKIPLMSQFPLTRREISMMRGTWIWEEEF